MIVFFVFFIFVFYDFIGGHIESLEELLFLFLCRGFFLCSISADSSLISPYSSPSCGSLFSSGMLNFLWEVN